MKIALLGYGRMGKAIESIAIKRGHTIVSKFDLKKEGEIDNADVAINFSTPSTAFQNIKEAFNSKIPVVSGTTGWLKDLDKIEKLAIQEKVGFLYSSNFSIGVNLFFQLNKTLSKLMNSYGYSVKIEEVHHSNKVDMPSGTAISLAEDIISKSNYKQWSLKDDGKEILKIKSSRKADTTGIHTVSYNSEFDKISIKHQSHSRVGYATGALMAAEWLNGKNGVFSMSDIFNVK